MVERLDAAIVGGGQAGLAMSRELHDQGVEHVVLERGRVGQSWRTERWDSLAFQFPNWSLQLPGWRYDGPDPDDFAGHGEIAATLDAYAAPLRSVLREHTEVTDARPADAGSGWLITTADGTLRCRSLIVATGPFQHPSVPPSLADAVPTDVTQLHSSHYRNPDQLPPGPVLVVGSGGSGSQIAEELCEAGRRVHLAISRHRRVPRRHRGRDATWWLLALGVLDRPLADVPDGRPPPSLLVTGVGGGHDMDVRALRAQGVQLTAPCPASQTAS